MKLNIHTLNHHCAKNRPARPMPPISKIEKTIMMAEQGDFLATLSLMCLYRFHTANTPAEKEVDELIEYTLDTMVEGFKDDRESR